MQSAKDPDRKRVYQHCLDLMAKSFELIDPATSRVAVPAGLRPDAGPGGEATNRSG